MADLIKAHNQPHDPESAAGPIAARRLNDLHHIHATTLLLAGVPVHVVAARPGHADPSITLRVYAHVVSEQLAEAADIFARSVIESGTVVSKSVSKNALLGAGKGL